VFVLIDIDGGYKAAGCERWFGAAGKAPQRSERRAEKLIQSFLKCRQFAQWIALRDVGHNFFSFS
jgi:hypothetical protein